LVLVGYTAACIVWLTARMAVASLPPVTQETPPCKCGTRIAVKKFIRLAPIPAGIGAWLLAQTVIVCVPAE